MTSEERNLDFNNLYKELDFIINESEQNEGQSLSICMNYLENKKAINPNIINLKNNLNNNIAQEFAEKGKYYHVKIIIQSYNIIYRDNPDVFNDFLTNENSEKKTIYEISILFNIDSPEYPQIIDDIYQYMAQNEKVIYKVFQNGRINIFHICAKENFIYPIIFYYERLNKYFQKNNILNLKNSIGLAPIHYAAYYSNKNIIDILIDYNADINIKDFYGDTPLHYGVKSGNYALVKKLIIYGADKYSKNKEGISPKDICIENNYTIMKRLFSGLCQIHSIKNQEKDKYLLFFIILSIIVKLFFIYFYKNLNNNFEMKDYNSKKILIQISLIFNILSISMSLFFKRYARKYYIKTEGFKKKIKNNISDIIKKYHNDTYKIKHICLICKHSKNSQMKHCIICKECVEKWDHHCFWLHSCINEYLMNFFIFFLFFLGCLIILDMIILSQFWIIRPFISYNYYINLIINCSFFFLEGILLFCLFGVLPHLFNEIYYKFIRTKKISVTLADYKKQKLIENV